MCPRIATRFNSVAHNCLGYPLEANEQKVMFPEFAFNQYVFIFLANIRKKPKVKLNEIPSFLSSAIREIHFSIMNTICRNSNGRKKNVNGFLLVDNVYCVHDKSCFFFFSFTSNQAADEGNCSLLNLANSHPLIRKWRKFFLLKIYFQLKIRIRNEARPRRIWLRYCKCHPRMAKSSGWV